MAKPDAAVEVVFVVDDSTVNSEGAGALVAFFLPILLNTAKFSRVNRARFKWCCSLLSSLPICRFCDGVAEGTFSCPSALGSGSVVCRCSGGVRCCSD